MSDNIDWPAIDHWLHDALEMQDGFTDSPFDGGLRLDAHEGVAAE